jgi:ElaB/YqjD/DUF883 family membrane-anchored ribosome-binding protein
MNVAESNADIHESISSVMNDACALLAATANATQENVIEARRTLSDTLRTSRETCVSLGRNISRSARPVNETDRANFYEAAGVTFGLGALIGFLMGRHR